MVKKSSVFMMMVLLVVIAASLIGISSIHQYVEGQVPPAKVPQQLQGAGIIGLVRVFDSPAGKFCTAGLKLQGPNSLGLKDGTDINLLSSSEHFCTLLVLSKIGKTDVGFQSQKITASSLPPAIRGAFTPAANYPSLYRISELEM